MNRKYVIIMSLVFAIGLGAMTFYFSREPKPEVMVRAALDKFGAARYLHSNVNMESFIPSSSLSIGPDNKPKVDSALVPVKVTGRVSLRRLSGEAVSSQSDLKVAIGSSLSRAEIDANAVMDGTGDTYLKVSGLPGTSESGIDLGTLNDRWFSLDRRSLAAIVLQKDLSAEPGANAVANAAAADFLELFRQFVSGDLFSLDRRMVNEFVAGHPTRHFAVRFNKEALGRLAATLGAALEDRPVASYDAESETARIGLDYVASGEIWIDRNSLELRKFGVELQPVSAERASLPVRFVAEFDDYSSPFEVKVPPGAVPFVDVVRKEILGL